MFSVCCLEEINYSKLRRCNSKDKKCAVRPCCSQQYPSVVYTTDNHRDGTCLMFLCSLCFYKGSHRSQSMPTLVFQTFFGINPEGVCPSVTLRLSQTASTLRSTDLHSSSTRLVVHHFLTPSFYLEPE